MSSCLGIYLGKINKDIPERLSAFRQCRVGRCCDRIRIRRVVRDVLVSGIGHPAVAGAGSLTVYFRDRGPLCQLLFRDFRIRRVRSKIRGV